MLKKSCLVAGMAMAAFTAGSAQAAVLLNETFDSDAGFTTSTPFFADAFGDFFGLTTAPTDIAPGGKAYTGFAGSYLTGMDLDGEGATLPITVSWTVDITGATDLEFSGLFAEFFDTPGDIDFSDDLSLKAQIDGGTVQTIIDFDGADFTSTSSGGSNGFFRLDGTGTALGSAAQSFVAPISGTGDDLVLTLSINLNSGDEDFGVDTFVVEGVIPEPASMALLGLGGLLMFGRKRRA